MTEDEITRFENDNNEFCHISSTAISMISMLKWKHYIVSNPRYIVQVWTWRDGAERSVPFYTYILFYLLTPCDFHIITNIAWKKNSLVLILLPCMQWTRSIVLRCLISRRGGLFQTVLTRVLRSSNHVAMYRTIWPEWFTAKATLYAPETAAFVNEFSPPAHVCRNQRICSSGVSWELGNMISRFR